jgi:hypothetical protein
MRPNRRLGRAIPAGRICRLYASFIQAPQIEVMRVLGPSSTAPAAAARKPSRPRGGFRIDDAAPAGPAMRPSPTAQLDGPDALIAIQGGPGSTNERRRKRLAAAQRTLDLLDRLRVSVLEGGGVDVDLNAIAMNGDLRDGAGGDAALDTIVDEISLRARVELAKRGR